MGTMMTGSVWHHPSDHVLGPVCSAARRFASASSAALAASSAARALARWPFLRWFARVSARWMAEAAWLACSSWSRSWRRFLARRAARKRRTRP